MRVTIGPRVFPEGNEPLGNGRMTVTVLLFASYAEALGASSLQLEVGSNATVAEVLASLRRLAGAEKLPPAPLVAVNEQYATRDRALVAGDEVAVIPPVAGG